VFVTWLAYLGIAISTCSISYSGGRERRRKANIDTAPTNLTCLWHLGQEFVTMKMNLQSQSGPMHFMMPANSGLEVAIPRAGLTFIMVLICKLFTMKVSSGGVDIGQFQTKVWVQPR
jgi:hypothetical protein